MKSLFHVILAAAIVAIAPLSSWAANGPGWLTAPLSPAQRVSTNTLPSVRLSQGPLPIGAGLIGPSLPVAKAALADGEVVALVASTGNEADVVTPAIQALADGLERNPANAFFWVRQNIEYSHYYGSRKGATLTLLERSGNDADQSALLVALLRASGFQAGYNSYMFRMPYTGNGGIDVEHWLNIDKLEFGNFQSARGIPNSEWAQANQTLYPGQVEIRRIIVEASIAGALYFFDPSYKVYEAFSSTNIPATSGFTVAAALTSAGGTESGSGYTGLAVTTFESYLAARYDALFTSLQASSANADPIAIIGGYRIAAIQPPQYLPLNGTVPGSQQSWNVIPTSMFSTIRVETTYIDTTRFLCSLQGQRMSLEFDGAGRAQLWLDDSVVATGASAEPLALNVKTSIHHPSPTNQLDQFITQTYLRGQSYIIGYAFDAGKDLIAARQRKLEQYRRLGMGDGSRQIVLESLNLIGLNWFRESELSRRLLSAQEKISAVFHHRVGRIAQETSNGKTGFYIDIGMQYTGRSSRLGTINLEAFSFADQLIASSMEHAVITQLQGGSAVGASTVRLVRNHAITGDVYRATPGNWSTILPVIQGTYPAEDLQRLRVMFETDPQPGNWALLPSTGQIILNSWKGAGYATHREFASGAIETGMLIGGGLMGGFSASDLALINAYIVKEFIDTPAYRTPTVVAQSLSVRGDPVDTASGQFIFSSESLSIGQAAPRGLSFGLRYHGGGRFNNSGKVGYGWTHSMDARLVERSEFENTLGGGSAMEAIPGIIGTRAVLELCRDVTSAKKAVIATAAAHWLADRLITNAVSLTLNERPLEFLKKPDGTFNSPRGLTVSLSLNTTLNPVVFEIKERNGSTFRFDTMKRLSTITDLWGRTATLTYDASDRLATATDAYGRAFILAYNGNNELASVSDTANSRSVSMLYTNGDLTKFTDPEGAFDTFEYDSNHRFVTHRDGSGAIVVVNTVFDSEDRVVEQQSYGLPSRTWLFKYAPGVTTDINPQGGRNITLFDARSRNIGKVDEMGKLWTMKYDGQDHLVQAISPLGAAQNYSVAVQYDGNHNVTGKRDATNVWDYFIYDAQNRLTRHTHTRTARYTDYTYNAQHLPLTVTELGSGVSSLVTQMGYDAFGNLNSVTPPNTPATTFSYNAKDEKTGTLYPGPVSDSVLYDAVGNPTTMTDARGKITTIAYNKRREPTSADAPLIPAVTTHYDSRRNVDSATNARGFTTTKTYSGNQKLLSSTFGGATVAMHYDDRDWLDEVTDALANKVKTTYRADGKPVYVDDPLLRRSSVAYDADGRTVMTLNPLNQGTWNQSISKRGEVLTVSDVTGTIDATGTAVNPATDGLSKNTTFFYLANGDLFSRTNRNIRQWTNSYDGLGRQTSSYSPTSKFLNTAYNNRNLVSKITEPSYQYIDFTYDSRGRVSTKIGKLYPSGVTDHSQSFTYDANSNPLTVTEGTAVLTRTYDDLNRISTYTSSTAAETLGYEYDENSNLKKLTYPDGQFVQYTYDSRDRMTSVTDWANRVTTMTWDDNNRLKTLTRPNGTKRGIFYDAAGQVSKIEERLANGTLIYLQTPAYDLAGRVTSTFTAPIPAPFTETPMTAAYDSDDKMTTLNGAALTYDTDGNSLVGPLPNGAWGSAGTSTGASGANVWDLRNRLTSITRSDNAQVVSYAYDAEGFLVGITTGGQTERLTVDPHGGRRSQVLVRNYQDGTKSRYVYGLGLLYEEKPDGSLRVFHYDLLGSTVALTDSAGVVTGRVQYGTFGAVATASGDGLATPFLWHGRHGVWTDKNTGLHQMRARWYSSALRRFLNPDPARFAGGSNFYLYANGDPVSMIDPFGLGNERHSESGPPGGFLADTFLNTGMLRDAVNVWSDSDWTSAMGIGGKFLSGIGMISGVVDAASNFIPGKAAATGSVKAGVKGLINAEVKHVAGDAVGALAHAGKTTVYHTVENGIVKYVGITDDMAARAAAHLREKGINIEQIPGLTGLAREDARAVEQVLIQTIRLGKDGGSLLNKINSIAKTNLNYSEALKRGVELLKQAGYSGF